MYNYLFESLLSILLGLFLGLELPSTYFSTQFCGPLVIVHRNIVTLMKGANVCFFEENAPLPESAAGASDYNVKRAKKFNKVMEIQVLWEK